MNNAIEKINFFVFLSAVTRRYRLKWMGGAAARTFFLFLFPVVVIQSREP